MKHSLAYLTLTCTWLLATLACSLQQAPPPIVVTATPLGGPATLEPLIITATPAATFAVAPLPTATLPPNQNLAAAQVASHNGHHEQAVAYYAALIADPSIDAALEAEAAFRLGQSARLEGLFSQSVIALTDFISQFPTDPRIGQAHFLRGEAYSGLGDWERAITDYERYLALKPGVIDSYAYERIGDARLNLNQVPAALAAYDLATQSARSLASSLNLREKLAASYLNGGDLGAALTQYDAILAEARNGVYRASIEYQAAQVEFAMGLNDRAQARLAAMMAQYPTTGSAYVAMQDLVRLGLPVDDWLRAQISYANGDYGDALAAINQYSTQLPVVPVEALLMLGRSYRALGNYPAAFTTFQTIINQYTADPSYGLAWLEQGATLYQEGDYANAILRYTEFAALNPQLPEAPRALWWAGYLYTIMGETERALSTFEQLGVAYPGAEQAQEGLLLAGTLAYNAGQIPRAQAIYTQLANSGTGAPKAQAFLWLGRLYQEAGQMDLARQSYQGAAQALPGDYFSVRGEDLLNGRAPFQPPPAYQFEFNEAQEQAEAEQWLRQTFGIAQEGALHPLSPALRTDPRMIRGVELWELGDYESAKGELESLREAYSGDPLASYQLAVFFADLGLYRSSIQAAATLLIASGADNFTAPPYLARLRYPIHYADLVLPAAEEWGVDPLLVFSLIRQESLYESFATSSAVAQGLMQIIPSTGAEINQKINWSADFQNSDLYRPYINVYFGVYYLSWVMGLVDNQPYAALAGYNGGPGNAMEWLSVSGPDIDLFIQTVGFDETKLYVERIYEQYTVYRHLYGVN
jgi:soluble lytic murein transglycosylase